MYRRIALGESARDFHQILRRYDKNELLLHYRMTRVAYGIKPSTFLAARCVRKNGQKMEVHFLRRQLRMTSMLMIVCQVHPPTKSQRYHAWCNRRLMKYGMELRKWTSNAPELIWFHRRTCLKTQTRTT